CQALDADTPRPEGMTCEAIRAARDGWVGLVEREQERAVFARQWADHLDQAPDVLADRLPGYVNLVAATMTALPSDPHFGTAVAASFHFDLLVVEEADHLTESEFLQVARRARRWVLAGEPCVEDPGL